MDDDGNCQFRAIAHQLGFPPDEHAQVRSAIVNELIINQSRYEDFLDQAVDPTFDHYVERMRRIAQSGEDSDQWGDDITLRAAANTYRITIRIYSSNGETYDREFNPETHDGHEGSTDLREIRVIYNGVNHYNSTCSTIGE